MIFYWFFHIKCEYAYCVYLVAMCRPPPPLGTDLISKNNHFEIFRNFQSSVDYLFEKKCANRLYVHQRLVRNPRRH